MPRECKPCSAKRSKTKYLWTPPEGSDLQPRQYNTEREARIKVRRRGGSYAALPSE